MTTTPSPEYRFFIFPKGGEPRTFTGRDQRQHWSRDGQAETIRNDDGTTRFLQGQFTLHPSKDQRPFKAYPNKFANPEPDPDAERAPEFDFYLLDAEGRIPTEPDPADPSKQRWKSSAGLWLRPNKDHTASFLRGTLTLESAEYTIMLYHSRPPEA